MGPGSEPGLAAPAAPSNGSTGTKRAGSSGSAAARISVMMAADSALTMPKRMTRLQAASTSAASTYTVATNILSLSGHLPQPAGGVCEGAEKGGAVSCIAAPEAEMSELT